MSIVEKRLCLSLLCPHRPQQAKGASAAGPGLDAEAYRRIQEREGTALEDLVAARLARKREAQAPLLLSDARKYFAVSGGLKDAPGKVEVSRLDRLGQVLEEWTEAGCVRAALLFCPSCPPGETEGLPMPQDPDAGAGSLGGSDGAGGPGGEGGRGPELWGRTLCPGPGQPGSFTRARPPGGAAGSEAAVSLPHAHFLPLQRPKVQMVEQEAGVLQELLRHFWACFPLATAARRDKAQRIHKALSEKYDTLLDLPSQAQGPERQQLSQLVRPLTAVLDAALRKYQDETAAK